MKSYLGFLFAILFSLQGASQDYSYYMDLFDKKIDENYSLLYLDYNNSFSSTSVPVSFIKPLYTGEYISRDKVNNALSLMNETNLAGIDGSYNMLFMSFIKSNKENTKLAITGGIHYNTSLDSEFNKNLFQFVFKGNNDFLGETVNLNQTNLNYSEYGIIKLGLLKITEENSTKQIVHINLSAIGGLNHVKGILNNAELEFNEFGDYINCDMEISANVSDLVIDRQEIRGLGGAIDFFGAHQAENGHIYFTSINNLGVIKWNQTPYNLNLDTTFNYDGIEISSLSFNSDTTFGNVKIDSLKYDYLKRINNYSVYLPAKIHIGYKGKLKNHEYVLGLMSRIKTNYTPMIYAKSMFNIKTIKTFAGPIISYGGFDKFSFGAEISSHFKYDTKLSVRCFHLEGFISSTKGTSQSIFISLSKGLFRNKTKTE